MSQDAPKPTAAEVTQAVVALANQKSHDTWHSPTSISMAVAPVMKDQLDGKS